MNNLVPTKLGLQWRKESTRPNRFWARLRQGSCPGAGGDSGASYRPLAIGAGGDSGASYRPLANKLRAIELGVAQGDTVEQSCRIEAAINVQTYYRWRSRYGGMTLAEAKENKRLREENKRLKHAVADLTLDNQILAANSARPGHRETSKPGAAASRGLHQDDLDSKVGKLPDQLPSTGGGVVKPPDLPPGAEGDVKVFGRDVDTDTNGGAHK